MLMLMLMPLNPPRCTFKGRVCHFGKYPYLLSFHKIRVKVQHWEHSSPVNGNNLVHVSLAASSHRLLGQSCSIFISHLTSVWVDEWQISGKWIISLQWFHSIKAVISISAYRGLVKSRWLWCTQWSKSSWFELFPAALGFRSWRWTGCYSEKRGFEMFPSLTRKTFPHLNHWVLW